MVRQQADADVALPADPSSMLMMHVAGSGLSSPQILDRLCTTLRLARTASLSSYACSSLGCWLLHARWCLCPCVCCCAWVCWRLCQVSISMS